MQPDARFEMLWPGITFHATRGQFPLIWGKCTVTTPPPRIRCTCASVSMPPTCGKVESAGLEALLGIYCDP